MPLKSPILLALCALAVGCTGPAPHVPRDWTHHIPPPIDSLENNTPRLQVIVAYGGNMPSHTMLRITRPDHALFWDPGGAFALHDPTYQRVADLVRNPTPALADILAHRWRCMDVAVEVFEWDLTDAEAHALADRLTGDAGTPPFPTARAAGARAAAVSRFLIEHAPLRARPDAASGWPQDLARALYRQPPDRVRLFRYDNQTALLTPPP